MIYLDFDRISEIVLNAVFTGVGVSIGTYLAQKALISHIDSLIERLDELRNRKKN